MISIDRHLILEDEHSFKSRNKAVVQDQPCKSEDKYSKEGGDDGTSSLTQPYNKEDEDLEVVY